MLSGGLRRSCRPPSTHSLRRSRGSTRTAHDRRDLNGGSHSDLRAAIRPSVAELGQDGVWHGLAVRACRAAAAVIVGPSGPIAFHAYNDPAEVALGPPLAEISVVAATPIKLGQRRAAISAEAVRREDRDALESSVRNFGGHLAASRTTQIDCSHPRTKPFDRDERMAESKHSGALRGWLR